MDNKEAWIRCVVSLRVLSMTLPFYALLNPKAIFSVTLQNTALPFDQGKAISIQPMLNHGLTCRRQPHRCPKINFMRCPITERLVQALLVLVPKIIFQVSPGFGDYPIFMKINVFVFR